MKKTIYTVSDGVIIYNFTKYSPREAVQSLLNGYDYGESSPEEGFKFTVWDESGTEVLSGHTKNY